jgi:predicted translin family RNA/ssDNA-binding protein
MLINSQISQDLNYAQEKIQENREIIAKLEEKMKDFNKIYQSYEAKYIGSASSELSSSILVKKIIINSCFC